MGKTGMRAWKAAQRIGRQAATPYRRWVSQGFVGCGRQMHAEAQQSRPMHAAAPSDGRPLTSSSQALRRRIGQHALIWGRGPSPALQAEARK